MTKIATNLVIPVLVYASLHFVTIMMKVLLKKNSLLVIYRKSDNHLY